MREIDFKAWDKITKRWCSQSWLMENWNYAVNSDTIELVQYTGLKDKNNVKIYEGDLMYEFSNATKKYDAVGIVTFGNFSAEIYDCEGWFLADKNGNQISEAGLQVRSDYFEVIGNVYENPEILETSNA